MILQDMMPNPLWAGPSASALTGATEGTLAPLLVLVTSMPFQFLESWIRSAAMATGIKLSGSLATVLGVPCASQLRILSNRLEH